MPATLRSYLELARLSNGPTVISNVLVGTAIALQGTNTTIADFPWISIALVTTAMLLFYVGGMAMNDVVDVEIDWRERPNRPIPSGRIPFTAARRFVVLCFILALALLVVCGLAAAVFGVALLAAITLYNLFHKRHAPSVILMGLCRGLVYLTVAAAIRWPIDLEAALPLAIAITIYVTLITIIARGEADNQLGLSRRLAMLMVLIAVAPAILLFPDDAAALIVTGIALIAWLVLLQRHLLVTPPRMKPAIMGWLAGICLLDAFYLALLDQPLLALVAGICFLITLAAHQSISGT